MRKIKAIVRTVELTDVADLACRFARYKELKVSCNAGKFFRRRGVRAELRASTVFPNRPPLAGVRRSLASDLEPVAYSDIRLFVL